jgi:hypothetical protein
MKKGVFTYLLSLFFIFLLFAKDIIFVFPSLFIAEYSLTAVQIDWSDEESERSRSSEEVSKINASEYIGGEHTLLLLMPVFCLEKDKNLPVNSSFTRTFYGSVLTPPPDKA